MSRQIFPAIFVSHGAPTLALDRQAPAYQFLQELGSSLGKPRAILIISAHWQTPMPTLSFAEQPETIYDFGGFAKELYQINYPAPGATELAERASQLLADGGIEFGIAKERGLDHGAWVPLMLMYPLADVPVTQLSLKLAGATEHYELGQRLSPLRDEGVLILATGSAVHNLRHLSSDINPPAWAARFDEFLYQNILSGDGNELLNYRSVIPDESRLAHPTEEHLLPLFVAMGAGAFDINHPGKSLHRSWTYGSLSMAAYAFA